jgi:hypothetical protein
MDDSAQLKTFQNIFNSAKTRDINESDTVMIITDFLSQALGWDKYSEITTEFAIRNTYCDLAIKTNDIIHYLIEVKAIGLELKDIHLRQALDYAANQGIDWVILTNGIEWQIHKVLFQKPIDNELIFSFDILSIEVKDDEAIYQLFLLSKEGVNKSALDEYQKKVQATNRFSIAALMQGEAVLKVLIREIKKLNKGVKIDPPYLLDLLRNEVLKRDVVEGENAEKAQKLVKKLLAKAASAKQKKAAPSSKAKQDKKVEVPQTKTIVEPVGLPSPACQVGPWVVSTGP